MFESGSRATQRGKRREGNSAAKRSPDLPHGEPDIPDIPGTTIWLYNVNAHRPGPVWTLVERQDRLVTELWKEQRQAQEDLVKGLCDVLKEQGTATTSSRGQTPTLQYRLNKLSTEDDIEAFLYAFEATAIAASWPKPQWVTILGPYLAGPSQVVLKTLPAADVGNYERVKAAILDHYEVTPETQRQRFRALRFKLGDRPEVLIMELRECATLVDPSHSRRKGYRRQSSIRTSL